MSPTRIQRHIAAGVVAVTLLAQTSVATAEAEASPDGIAQAMSERRSLGLPSDLDTVNALLNSGADVGTPRWGIPMTAEEEITVDPAGRMAFANDVYRRVIPFVESLPTFAGAYMDQMHDGRFVVLLTERDATIETQIERMMPPVTRGLVISLGSRPYAELAAAADEVWRLWPALLPAVPLEGVAVDVHDGVIALAASNAVAATELALQQLEDQLGVPVEFGLDNSGVEAVCNGPDNCHTPMRAGIRIRQGSTSGSICTMAFHITKNGDEQFLTAGHCGYSGSNNWYHQSYGLIGSEQATLYVPNGKDAMRVQMPDSQASRLLYLSVRVIDSARNPILGEMACATLGNSNRIDCGYVSNINTAWTGDACGCTIVGADVNDIAIIGGDSGSPIVAGSGSSAPAIGIVNRTDGRFAKMQDVIASFGFALYVP